MDRDVGNVWITDDDAIGIGLKLDGFRLAGLNGDLSGLCCKREKGGGNARDRDLR